jgi:hypothetical protein
MTGADVFAHETLEAYASAQGQSYREAHNYAAQYYGQLAKTDYYRWNLPIFGVIYEGVTDLKVNKPGSPDYTLRLTIRLDRGAVQGDPGPWNVTKVEKVP